jgi:hypothetical protein
MGINDKVFNTTKINGFGINEGVVLMCMCVIVIVVVILAANFTYMLDDVTLSVMEGNTGFDFWWGTHVLLFAIFGFLFPRQPIRFFILGGTWELFELMFNYIPIFDKQTDGNIRGNPDKSSLFYPKKIDLLGNTLGYFIGWGVAEIVDNTEFGQKYIKREPSTYFAF